MALEVKSMAYFGEYLLQHYELGHRVMVKNHLEPDLILPGSSVGTIRW